MTAVVLRADARRLPLPDASVDLIVTSPPYFGLRSYTDTRDCPKCRDLIADGRDPRQAWPDYQAHWDRDHKPLPYAGQIGSEGTPAEWVAALVECTREWVRVLKPSGSIFVNLGDKFAGSGGDGNSGLLAPKFKGNTDAAPPSRGKRWGYQPKSLLGLPWRYALACTDELGLILRRDIVWAKPNGLPESVTDRCRSSHEYLFHLVKQPRYYAAVDEIRSPATTDAHTLSRRSRTDKRLTAANGGRTSAANPLGSLPGSVWRIEDDRIWDIPSQPLQVPAHLGIDHFAAFPLELPRRCIAGWSPPGVCTVCGEGRRPVVDADFILQPDVSRERNQDHGLMDLSNGWRKVPRGSTQRAITGYACACGVAGRDSNPQTPIPGRSAGTRLVAHTAPDPNSASGHPSTSVTLPPTTPAIVLDPFAGTGTTMLAASALGRVGIGCDLSMDYARLAKWRTQDRAEIAKAMQVPKPPPIPDGQEALFT